MQSAILSQLSCSLVPHSTRPFWHQKWEEQCQQQQNEMPKSSNSARRRLFQEEMDPEEEKSNQEFVQRLLAELAERYKQKWNFDFDQGQPMNSANHQFQYEAVAANQVPGFYRISTIFGQNPPHKNVRHERDENHWSPKEENATKMNGGIGEFLEGKSNADLDEQMMAESDGMGPMKSPSRILAKSKRRTTENETPKRSKKVSGSNGSMEWAMEEGTNNGQIVGEQSKITDFLNVRKGLATSRSCKKESAGGTVMNSPKCRRRHSLCAPISMQQNSSPIKKVSVDFYRAQRRSQRLFHARQMLFK